MVPQTPDCNKNYLSVAKCDYKKNTLAGYIFVYQLVIKMWNWSNFYKKTYFKFKENLRKWMDIGQPSFSLLC